MGAVIVACWLLVVSAPRIADLVAPGPAAEAAAAPASAVSPAAGEDFAGYETRFDVAAANGLREPAPAVGPEQEPPPPPPPLPPPPPPSGCGCGH